MKMKKETILGLVVLGLGGFAIYKSMSLNNTIEENNNKPKEEKGIVSIHNPFLLVNIGVVAVGAGLFILISSFDKK